MKKILLLLFLFILFFLFSFKSTQAQTCNTGDGNGDGKVDGFDYVIWWQKFNTTSSGAANGDFNCDGKVDGFDYVVWWQNFGKSVGTTPTATPGAGGYIDNAKCNPDLGSSAFSTNITNQFLPFSTGMANDHVIYNSGTGERVRFRILGPIKQIPGADGNDPVTALVLEEFETVNGSWTETSHNWFAQTGDGTVCYFGENVFTPGSPNGGASGSWEAGKNGARAGIMMPPNPTVGMNWLIEDAAPVAYEDGVVQQTGATYTTPAGTFNNVVYIVEDSGASQKRYAPGVGMIFDDGMVLISY